MAISLTHTTPAVGTDAGNGEIGKTQWNENHTITMATSKLLGRTTAGTGAVEEISVGSGLTFASGTLKITQVVQLLVFDDDTDVTTGDGAGNLFFRVPSTMNGLNLVGVAAAVGTAGTTGTTDIQIHNITQAADMLTTKLTVDSGETDSSTATAAVIDTANDDVATGDKIRIDVDATSTTKAKGLLVELQFGL